MRGKLVWRNLTAHPVRAGLTLVSMAIAVFLLCILRGAVVGLTTTVEKAASNRLWVQSAVSLFVELPLSYQSKLASVADVDRVCRWQWFGGVYRDPSNFFAQFGVDGDTFLPSYPEFSITAGSYDAFMKNRTGCVVGKDLAARFEWEVGSKVQLQGAIFPRVDGAAWEFTVDAIYASSTPSLDMQTMYFHFDYLRETLEQGAAQGPPGAGVYLLAMHPGTDPTRAMAEVDAMFQNGPQRVQTTTEAEFNRQFISMLGNVPALLGGVGGAVVFAIFFAVLNTMLMAARERTRDAGILKALGFGSGTIVGLLLVESLLVCVVGGLAGAGLALAIEEGMQSGMSRMLPGFAVSGGVVWLGLGIAVAVGTVSGLIPGWRLARTRPVVALRTEA